MPTGGIVVFGLGPAHIAAAGISARWFLVERNMTDWVLQSDGLGDWEGGGGAAGNLTGEDEG